MGNRIARLVWHLKWLWSTRWLTREQRALYAEAIREFAIYDGLVLYGLMLGRERIAYERIAKMWLSKKPIAISSRAMRIPLQLTVTTPGNHAHESGPGIDQNP